MVEKWGRVYKFCIVERQHNTEQESRLDRLLEQYRDGRELLELNYDSFIDTLCTNGLKILYSDITKVLF